MERKNIRIPHTPETMNITRPSFTGPGFMILLMVAIAIPMRETNIMIIIRKLESLSLSYLIPSHTSTEEIVSTPLSMPSERRPAEWKSAPKPHLIAVRSM
jgi:hypothetical protein